MLDETPERFARSQALEEVDECGYSGSLDETGRKVLVLNDEKYRTVLSGIKDKPFRAWSGWSPNS